MPLTDTPFDDRLRRVRGLYAHTPWIEPRADESPLLRSWQRSESVGISSEDRVAFELVTRSLLSEIDDRHHALIELARPEMLRLAHAVRRADCAVMLVNERAVVVDRLLHDAAARAPLRAVSRKGVNLDERCIGTTAPSIVLSEGVPYLVGREAHFVASNRAFFCVAAPVDDPLGRRLGALNIAAYDSVPSFDVLSLVVHAAAGVENRLFAPSAGQIVVHFHARPELVGTAMEGILAVDAADRIVGVNRCALKLLCQTREALIGSKFGDLMAADLRQVFGPARAGRLAEMQTAGGLQVYAEFATAEAGPARPEAALVAEAVAAADDMPARLAGQGASAGDAPALRGLSAPPTGRLRDAELQLIRDALERSGGKVAAAARQLGISRSTIYRRLGEAPPGD